MTTGRAGTATPQLAQEQDSTPWTSLGRRQIVELTLPGW